MLIRHLMLAALVLVTACGAPAPAPFTDPMVIGDTDPVRFSGRQPTTYPVQGMDAARFQTSVDWERAKAVGIEFVFLKATEGGDLLDPAFQDHWRGAGRAGIKRGAYHFYYFCTAPEVQAQFFIRTAPKTRGSLPPVLDMEWNPFSPTCQRRPDAATVQDEMRRWLDLVTAHYGQRPIIYTTPGFYEDAQLNTFKGYEFWLRTTAKTPAEAYPGQPWRFWQYTATGTLPNTAGSVDINAFNGSTADWEAWLDRRTIR
ncbi:GH25 family lysozyme [Tateyamaria sp. ANG-S1]|uniref:GH25 family lysozyme n=1 Tax=Tateyamaria sp. ANG-S1 TaxID=1577905 RepID=UPI00057C371A|nr:GH25 family lysozyme [Tateyamaria sp. ANG-S1]KIC46187.1 glycoside hydrolase [Tateyamaria sp. ANG-S1]